MTKFRVLTEHPVAVDSPDHTIPGGTMHDSSRNPEFNKKLFSLFEGRKFSLCDLGCAGGGFVKDMLDAGHDAIGIEGSDYSTKWDGPIGNRKPGRRAEWATIPDNLFTADITKPLEILAEIPGFMYFTGIPPQARFDVISAWEVMEHLPEAGIPQLITNVLNHLAEGGMWIMSVSEQPGGPHHVTVRPRHWWEKIFADRGLHNDQSLVNYFGNDWIRGPLQNAPMSFHLILKRG